MRKLLDIDWEFMLKVPLGVKSDRNNYEKLEKLQRVDGGPAPDFVMSCRQEDTAGRRSCYKIPSLDGLRRCLVHRKYEGPSASTLVSLFRKSKD